MIKLSLVFFIFSTTVYTQVKLTPVQLMNLAGKQRMYIERLAKAKIDKAYNVDLENADRQLAMGIILFEQNLKILQNYKANDSYNIKVSNTTKLWKDFQQEIKSFDSNAASVVFKNNDAMLDACNEIVNELKLHFKSKIIDGASDYASQIVNFCAASGSLRYLSQRVALQYVYIYNNSHTSNDELIKALDLFENNLAQVLSCQYNDSETEEIISTLFIEWNKIKQLTNEGGRIISSQKAANPAELVASCTNILALSEKLTSKYVALGK